MTALDLDVKEIYRYMGIRGEADEQTALCVAERTEELFSLWEPRSQHRRFSISVGEDSVLLKEAGLTLPSRSLARLLKGCDYAVLLAATLGGMVDRRIRLYNASDLLKALALDCCANEAIEKYCDREEELIRHENEGYYLTRRFSPGYGDLPLTYQKDFISLLDTNRRMGLSMTSTLLLTPKKSVTAILGLSKEPRPEKALSKCDSCDQKDQCAFSQKGGSCLEK